MIRLSLAVSGIADAGWSELSLGEWHDANQLS